MKKIISLYKRNYDTDYFVRNEIVDGAEWVVNGEGIATRKYDGTCCLIEDGKFFKRYEVKKGSFPPDNFIPANPVDEKTGKQQGWVPVGEGPEDKYHREAFDNQPDGTYELVGPKIQGNPESFDAHVLIAHADAERYPDFPRDFEGIKSRLGDMNIEGVVWHHEDGRMVKIKRKDFFKKRVK
jgi:hypothetical protein